MGNPVQYEDAFQDFMKDLKKWIPDGIIDIDLKVLDELGLLHHDQFIENDQSDQFPHYFHVIETPDKVTLFNHQFVVWIVPQVINEVPCTMTLIALMHAERPHLELVFSTSGVYNTPKFVLRILRHYLSEVIDTEAIISTIDKSQN